MLLAVLIRLTPWPTIRRAWLRRAGEGTRPARLLLVASSLFLIYIHILGIDYAFVFLGLTVAARLTGAAACVRASTRRRSLRLRRLVHLLSQLVRGLSQSLPCAVHLRLVIRLERLLCIGNR